MTDTSSPAEHAKPTTVDPDNSDNLSYWCDVFGVTVEQLQESVLAAGSDPEAVRSHLLNQGSSAGAG